MIQPSFIPLCEDCCTLEGVRSVAWEKLSLHAEEREGEVLKDLLSHQDPQHSVVIWTCAGGMRITTDRDLKEQVENIGKLFFTLEGGPHASSLET